MKRIYIASAYSHPDPTVMELRFKEAVDLVGSCMAANNGTTPQRCYYSPIVHNHPVAIFHRLPKGIDYWFPLNKAELLRSSEMWIASFRIPVRAGSMCRNATTCEWSAATRFIMAATSSSLEFPRV